MQRRSNTPPDSDLIRIERDFNARHAAESPPPVPTPLPSAQPTTQSTALRRVVEMLIVVVIVGVLALVSLPLIAG